MEDVKNNVIQSTKSYEQFKLLDNNRAVDQYHVRRLVRTLGENPRTLAAQPILVNHKFQVIDGQHRLEACKQLNFPVFYIVVPNITISDTRMLNANQKTWTVSDFVKSFADGGDKNYQRYQELMESFNYAHSVLLEACDHRYNSGTDTSYTSPIKMLKSGDLNLTQAKLKRALSKLEKATELKEINSIVGSKVYAVAVLRIQDSDEYSHARMKSKLAMYGSSLEMTASLREAARNLEDVYNNRQKTGLARFSIGSQ